MTAYERVIYVYIKITKLSFVNYCTNVLSRHAGTLIMEPIQLSALGRTFRVGDLYNYFKDNIMSSGKHF